MQDGLVSTFNVYMLSEWHTKCNLYRYLLKDLSFKLLLLLLQQAFNEKDLRQSDIVLLNLTALHWMKQHHMQWCWSKILFSLSIAFAVWRFYFVFICPSILCITAPIALKILFFFLKSYIRNHDNYTFFFFFIIIPT